MLRLLVADRRLRRSAQDSSAALEVTATYALAAALAYVAYARAPCSRRETETVQARIITRPLHTDTTQTSLSTSPKFINLFTKVIIKGIIIKQPVWR
jgi:hypothetical protein